MPKTFRTALSIWLKKKSLKKRGVILYNNVVFSGIQFAGKAVIEPYCRLFGDPAIVVGDNFYMNVGCHVQGNINFGRDVMIGPKTVIWGRDHGMELSKPMSKQDHIKSDITVGDDVWIGANVTILKGVTIASGAVIGAGAVVTKNIPKFAVAAGNPAKVIKYRG